MKTIGIICLAVLFFVMTIVMIGCTTVEQTEALSSGLEQESDTPAPQKTEPPEISPIISYLSDLSGEQIIAKTSNRYSEGLWANGVSYYINSNGFLCKINDDDTGYQRIIQPPGNQNYYVEIYGISNHGIIFAQRYYDSYAIDTESGECVQLTTPSYSGELQPINLVGVGKEKMFYLINRDTEKKLYISNFDGSNEECIFTESSKDVKIKTIMLSENYIYFFAESSSIYRSDLDGGNFRLLTQFEEKIDFHPIGAGDHTLCFYTTKHSGGYNSTCIYDIESDTMYEGVTEAKGLVPLTDIYYDTDDSCIYYYENKLKKITPESLVDGKCFSSSSYMETDLIMSQIVKVGEWFYGHALFSDVTAKLTHRIHHSSGEVVAID